jgi:hypothetical protein
MLPTPCPCADNIVVPAKRQAKVQARSALINRMVPPFLATKIRAAAFAALEQLPSRQHKVEKPACQGEQPKKCLRSQSKG